MLGRELRCQQTSSKKMPYDASHIYRTALDDLSDDDIIWIHLNARPVISCSDYALLSTLGGTLEEKRAAAARDRSNVIVPTLATFAVIDQIGSTYERPSRPVVEGQGVNAIKRCLHHFTPFQYHNDEVKALNAFRNAMMHDASLVDRGPNGKGPFHRFSFCRDLETLIRLPANAWDGQWGRAPLTLINRERLHQLADEIVASLRQSFLDGDLTCRIDIPALFDKYILKLPNR